MGGLPPNLPEILLAAGLGLTLIGYGLTGWFWSVVPLVGLLALYSVLAGKGEFEEVLWLVPSLVIALPLTWYLARVAKANRAVKWVKWVRPAAFIVGVFLFWWAATS